LRSERSVAVWIVAREIKEVDAREDDEKSAEQRDCVYSGCGVEALEKEEGRDEGTSREAYVVEGIDATYVSFVALKDSQGIGAYMFVENWLSALLK
jgi:hypothetical protein